MTNQTNNPNKPMPAWMNYMIGESNKRRPDTSKKVHVLAAGKFGTGKTYFANTFPKAFWIDTDLGMATTRKSLEESTAPGVRFFPGDPVYDTIMSIIADARSGREPLDQYESIILDGISSLSRVLLYEILGGSTDPARGRKAEFDAWMTLRGRLTDIVGGLRTLPHHVCATILTDIDKDEASGAYVGIFSTLGGFREDVGAMFDEVYVFEKRRARSNEPGDVIYEANTQYHPKFDVKSRLAQAGNIPSKIANPTFSDLYTSREVKRG